MAKVRKSVIKRIAKVYAANILRTGIGETDLLTQDEQDFLYEEIMRIADRISEIEVTSIDQAIELYLN
jgi:hypothetical protein